jgi:hypothetical protein
MSSFASLRLCVKFNLAKAQRRKEKWKEGWPVDFDVEVKRG